MLSINCYFIPNIIIFSGETRKAPLYEIILRGIFESSNGDPFSPSCKNEHGINFYQSARDTMPSVNSALGDTLCVSAPPGAFSIISVSTIFYSLDTSVSW